jgi:hypothetical protein
MKGTSVDVCMAFDERIRIKEVKLKFTLRGQGIYERWNHVGKGNSPGGK